MSFFLSRVVNFSQNIELRLVFCIYLQLISMVTRISDWCAHGWPKEHDHSLLKIKGANGRRSIQKDKSLSFF